MAVLVLQESNQLELHQSASVRFQPDSGAAPVRCEPKEYAPKSGNGSYDSKTLARNRCSFASRKT